MDTAHLYLSAESNNLSLLKDIEQAVTKVLEETYPDVRYDDD